MEIDAETWTHKTTGLKKWLPYIVLVIFIILFYFYLVKVTDYETAYPVSITENDSIFIYDSSSHKTIDSLKNFTAIAVQELHKYEALKKEYEAQEAEIIYKPIVDSSAIIALRSKLNAANNEISRLNGELATLKYKRPDKLVSEVITYTQPAIETPDSNSIVISLDGRSRKGNIQTNNLTVYLIPYSSRVKKLMSYDSSCSGLLATSAKYYNGVYFFNNVSNGTYIIKICTYMGDWKKIKKDQGKYNLTMQVSPPIQ